MKKIPSVNFSLFTDHERLTLVRRLLAILMQLKEEDAAVAELLFALDACLVKLEAAMTHDRKSSLTKQINGNDDIRDEALAMIRATLRLYLKKSNTSLRTSAEELQAIYDKAFENVNINNNAEQTAGIDNFLASTAGDSGQNLINRLRLNDEFESLKTAHPEYVTLLAERAKIKETDETPHLRPSRRELHAELRYMASHLNFWSRRNSATHSAVADEIAAPIAEMYAIAKSRDTRVSSEVQEGVTAE